MPNFIDKSYFTELQNAEPDTLCRNNRCRYHADEGSYSLDIWGDRYLINTNESKIEYQGVTQLPHDYFELFVIYYLLRVKDCGPTGEWISEKDVPGGPTFFRGPHLVPTEMISSRFGDDIESFCSWCEKLSGTRIEMADAAYRFEITADIPVVVLYWCGDEDFPAEAKVLYDRSVIELLTLDILFALAVGVCARIGSGDSPP